MIKKIPSNQVQVGMYVDRLDRDWFDHSFFSSRFLVKDATVLARLRAEKIAFVFIDTEKGCDVAPEPEPALPESAAASTEPPAPAARVSLMEERSRARAIYGEATAMVKHLLGDARLGRQIDLQAMEPMAEKMIASAFRNPHALISVARLKSKDEYTFMHSVSVAAISAAFARFMQIPEADIREIVRGALLHDVGKILVPDTILNKPGSLTDDEFKVMRRHADLGIDTLSAIPGFSDKAMEAVAMHHERNDGTGYPHGLKGDQISLVGQISAVVDVYDALTSLRIYKAPWEPSLALKKMLEWSPGHFDTALVQRFIRFLGIYPVGSLVELASGLVGIVVDQTSDLLRPHLLVVYNAKHRHYVKPQMLELDCHHTDRIVGVVSAGDYGIDVANFL